jgi:hypothetical protein
MVNRNIVIFWIIFFLSLVITVWAVDNNESERLQDEPLQFEMDFPSKSDSKPLSAQDTRTPELKKEEQPSLSKNATIATPQQHENGY